jgi:hypothetical protein
MNYKETIATGTSWVRCRAITITNAFQENIPGHIPEIPTAYFTEEKVVNLEGVKMLIPVGSCSKVFNPFDEITLINSATGEITGETVTHAKLYEILYSLYLQTAQERDAAVAAIVANTAAIEAAVT